MATSRALFRLALGAQEFGPSRPLTALLTRAISDLVPALGASRGAWWLTSGTKPEMQFTMDASGVTISEPGNVIPRRALLSLSHAPPDSRVVAASVDHDPGNLLSLFDRPPAADTAMVFLALRRLGRPWAVVEFERNGLTDSEDRQVWTTAAGAALEELAALVEALLRRIDRPSSSLLEATHDAVILLDALTFEIIEGNAHSLSLFGFESVDDLVAASPMDLSVDVQPDGQRAGAKVRALTERALLGRATTADWIARHRDGTEIPTTIEISSVLIEDRPAVRVVIRDRSAQVRAERAAREGELRLRGFIDHTPAPIFMKDENLRYVMVNRFYERMVGLDEDQLRGQSDFDLYPLERATRIRRTDEAVLESGDTVEAEENVEADGVMRRFRIVKYPLFDDEGRLAGVCGVGYDISDRYTAEQALRASEERFRQAFDGANTGICLVSLDRRIMQVNPRLARFWGYDPSELVGRPIASMNHPADRGECPDQIDQMLAGGRDSATFSEHYLRSDGQGVYADVAASVVADDDGKPLYLVVHVIDTTERRALEERLRQGEKMEAIGQLAGGIAHDVNNQLGGILGYAELLSHKLDDPIQRSYCDAIIRSAMRTADFTAQLLSFARKERTASAEISLHELIEEVVSLLRRSVGPHIEVVTELGAQRSRMLSDPSQLQSALLNLGLNARDAMPDGGRITYRTSLLMPHSVVDGDHAPDISYLELIVSDTGSGMSPEVKRHLFEPFFTTKEKGKGTGLGLASVYAAVTNHGGSISVDSVESEGTTFWILLPLLGEQASVVA